MTHSVSMGKLNPTHSLIHSPRPYCYTPTRTTGGHVHGTITSDSRRRQRNDLTRCVGLAAVSGDMRQSAAARHGSPAGRSTNCEMTSHMRARRPSVRLVNLFTRSRAPFRAFPPLTKYLLLWCFHAHRVDSTRHPSTRVESTRRAYFSQHLPLASSGNRAPCGFQVERIDPFRF